MSYDEEWWWWTNRQGDLKTVNGQELRDDLGKGVLDPDVLIWKEGWVGWLQATEIAQLAPALPAGTARTPVAPQLDASITSPPPPPLERYVARGPAPAQAKHTLLGISTATGPAAARPAPPPRLAATPPRPGSRPGDPPRPATGRAPGAPPRPLSSSQGAPSPPPRRPSARPPPPPRLATAPRTVSATPADDAVLLDIDVELEEEPAAEATAPDATQSDAAVALNESSSTEAPADNVRPSLIIPVGTASGDATHTPGHEPIVPVASDPDNEAPTRMMAPLSERPPAEPVAPIASGPENELPTQIKQDAPHDETPLPSWSDELDRDSVPDVVVPRAPLPAFASDNAGAYPAGDLSAHAAGYETDEAGESLDAALAGRTPGNRRRIALVLGVVGSAVLVLLIAGGIALLRGNTSDRTAIETSANTAIHTAQSIPPPSFAAANSSVPAKKPSNAACTLTRQGRRLAKKVAIRVPPYLATAPGATIALGFAVTPTKAVGVKLDPASLELTGDFLRDGKRNVLGVVPLVRGSKLDFAVDRDGSPLSYAHTIDATPPFIIGLSATGMARTMSNNKPETIWPGGNKKHITEPRIVSVKGVGHAVTFRRGGRKGEVRVGWLTPDGAKKTDLVEIKADGPRVGTPNIAVNDREVLVTFAARPSDDAAWTVRLAHAPLGKAPDSSVRFRLPPGGPGGDAISPASVGLPGGRWLLQWTEGKPGSRAVRAQTLGADLEPIGEPVTLSPAGRDSGQGAMWRVGEHVLSIFLVRSDSDYELWGAGLTCPLDTGAGPG